jgi:hypothetical protein
MSSGNIDSAADALAGAFQVDSAQDLRAVIESLPEFCRVLHEGLAGLDGAITEQGGPFLPQTGAAIASMAQSASAMLTEAEETAAAWTEESGFWLGGE